MKEIKINKNIYFLLLIFMIVFGYGCSDKSNITHEMSGVIISEVTPNVLTLITGETNEAEIVKNGKFNSATIKFKNLNAIPLTLKYYKVEYYDGYNGEKISTLAFGADLSLTIGGTSMNNNANNTTANTTQQQESNVQGTVTLELVNQKVKNEMYRNLTEVIDNRILIAKVTFYGIDYNANGVELNASITIVP